jgi:hypothetical protein
MSQKPVLFPQEAAVVQTLFREFLAVHADPDGGHRLHALYAAEAPVALEGCLFRKGETDREAFARAHRHVCMQGIGGLPVYERVALLADNVEADGSRAVGWFKTVESGDGQHATVALGVRRDGGEWRIGWCIVAPALQNWSYRQGLLQTLAEYPWMLSDQPVLSRSSLDASYRRLFRQSKVQLSFLPESRFSCHMSSACCKFDYSIVLPVAAQVLIDAIPWEEIQPALKGTKLDVRSDGQLQLKENREPCRFLGEHRQCLIHKTLGRQPFGPCAVFPFAFAQTPEGVAVSTSFVCGSVRNRLGPLLLERQGDVRERLFLAPVRSQNSFRLAPALEIPWKSFRQIETVLLDLLDQSHVPLHQRLHAGNRLLDALRRNEPIDLSAWLEKPPGTLTDDYRVTLRTYLAKILAWDRRAFTRLPQRMSVDLHHDCLRDEPVVVDILKNLLFSKVYSYPYDLTTAHNMSILLYVLTLIMQSAFDEPLPDELWQELAALGGHGLLASLLPDSAPQELKEFLGSSEFGQWALWYPQS